jgi:hypothetical protein
MDTRSSDDEEDMSIFVLAGWPGSVYDMRVFKDAPPVRIF